MSYEIVPTRFSYYVVIHNRGDGKCDVVERCATRQEAENLAHLLAWITEAPRRLAAH